MIWQRIEDLRDPAIMSPEGRPRYELLFEFEEMAGETLEDELPDLPAGATHAWQHEGRWFCE
jgi:hypothetical protein